MSFWTGQKEKMQQVPTKTGGQMDFINQLLSLLGGQGIGGAGQGLQHFMDILGGNTQAFEAPLMRQFNEEIVPGIAERFSAAGGQRSGAFGRALGAAGAGLQENLGALRGNLKNQAASNLLNAFQGLGQLGSQNTFENILRPGTPGFLQMLGGGLGQGIGEAGIGALTGGGSSLLKLLQKFFGGGGMQQAGAAGGTR